MPLAHRRRCGGPWMWRPQRRRRRGRSRWEPAAPGRDSWTLPREADAAVNLDRSFGNTPRSCCCVGPGPMPSRSDAQRCFATARCRTCSRHERSASRMVRPSSATLRGYRGSFVAKDVGERALIAVRTSRGVRSDGRWCARRGVWWIASRYGNCSSTGTNSGIVNPRRSQLPPSSTRVWPVR
jgi:hypothetical protein